MKSILRAVLVAGSALWALHGLNIYSYRYHSGYPAEPLVGLLIALFALRLLTPKLSEDDEAAALSLLPRQTAIFWGLAAMTSLYILDIRNEFSSGAPWLAKFVILAAFQGVVCAIARKATINHATFFGSVAALTIFLSLYGGSDRLQTVETEKPKKTRAAVLENPGVPLSLVASAGIKQRPTPEIALRAAEGSTA